MTLSIGGVSGSTSINVISSGAITPTVRSTTWINLSWITDGNAQYYQVFRSTSAGFTPSEASMVANGVTTTSFDDEVSAGTSYYYQVYAVNSDSSLTLIGVTTATTPSRRFCRSLA